MTTLRESLADGDTPDDRGVHAGDGARVAWPDVWQRVGRVAGALARRPSGSVVVVHNGPLDALVVTVASLLCGRDVLSVADGDRPVLFEPGPRVVGISGAGVPPAVPGAEVVDLAALLAASRSGSWDEARPEGRLLTARADGVGRDVVTAADLARSATRLRDAIGVTAEDVLGAPLAAPDGLGLACVLLAWSSRADLVLADPVAVAADPLAWPRVCARRRLNVGMVSPVLLRTMAPAIKDTTENLDLSPIRVLVVGSDPEPVTADELLAFNDAAMECSFDEVALCPSYTTAGGAIAWSMTPPQRLWRSRVVSETDLDDGRWRPLLTDGGREIVSCGPVLPGVAVRTSRDAVGPLLVRETDPPGEWEPTGDEGYAAEEVFVTCRATARVPAAAGREPGA